VVVPAAQELVGNVTTNRVFGKVLDSFPETFRHVSGEQLVQHG
jgi:hypothetical protein